MRVWDLLLIALMATSTARAADAPRCSADEVLPVSFQELTERPTDFVGRCVRVSGVLDGGRLYADLDAVYALNGQPDLGWHPFPEIVFVHGELPPKFWWDRRDVEITGKVGGMSMCMIPPSTTDTWCDDGPMQAAVISSARVRVLSDVPRRYVGDAARAKHGDVTDFDPASADYSAFGRLFAGLFEALKVQDERPFLHLVRVRERDLESPRAALHTLLRTENALTRFLRAHGVPAIKLFALKTDARANPTLQAGVVDAAGCICLKDSCEGLWPISRWDLALLSDLPFACVTGSASTRDGVREYTGGFYEPRW